MTWTFIAFTVLLWIAVLGVDGPLKCLFLPAAIISSVLTIIVAQALQRPFGYSDTPLNGRDSRLRIIDIGPDYVEFYHPEGGSWSYGLAEDLRAVNGVKYVESLGGWYYRMFVDRNPENAARVLDAAYRFRTEPKAVRNGAIMLNESPGFDILAAEAAYELE